MSFRNKKEERFASASPDQRNKAQQIYEYLYETEDESEKGEILRALGISIVMFVLAIAIAFHYIGGETSADDSDYVVSTTANQTTEDLASESTANEESESSSTEDPTTEETQQENSVEYVAQGNVADFSNCLSPDKYAQLTIDSGDTIVYPKNFFTSVSMEDGNVSFKAAGDYPQYNIYITSAQNSDAIEEVKNRISTYKSEMDSVSYQHPSDESLIKVGSDGYSKNVLKGMLDESKNIGVYYVITSNGSSTKILEFKYNIDSAREEGQSDEDYMINCLYCGASFSGSSKSTITYNEYMNQ